MTLSGVCAGAMRLMAMTAAPATAPTIVLRVVVPIMISSLAGMGLLGASVAPPWQTTPRVLCGLADPIRKPARHICEAGGAVGGAPFHQQSVRCIFRRTHECRNHGDQSK